MNIYLASASPQRRALLRQLGCEPQLCPVEIAEELPDGTEPARFCGDVSEGQAELHHAVQHIARAKLAAALPHILSESSGQAALILAADTLVAAAPPDSAAELEALQRAGARLWGAWLLLGKAEESEEAPEAARQFLRYLSGRRQVVCSAVAFAFTPPQISAEIELAALARKFGACREGCWHSSGPYFGYSETSELQFRALSEGEISAYLATEEWRGAAGAYRFQGQGARLVERQSGSQSNIIGLPLEFCAALLDSLGAL